MRHLNPPKTATTVELLTTLNYNIKCALRRGQPVRTAHTCSNTMFCLVYTLLTYCTSLCSWRSVQYMLCIISVDICLSSLCVCLLQNMHRAMRHLNDLHYLEMDAETLNRVPDLVRTIRKVCTSHTDTRTHVRRYTYNTIHTDA